MHAVRQRTIGSPARDYIPLLRGAGWFRYVAGKALGIKNWSFDEKEEKAREYRRTQQVYIQEMLNGLKKRIADGDETPSILGNILRQGLLKEEEVLLASYTGSMSPWPPTIPPHCISPRSRPYPLFFTFRSHTPPIFHTPLVFNPTHIPCPLLETTEHTQITEPLCVRVMEE